MPTGTYSSPRQRRCGGRALRAGHPYPDRAVEQDVAAPADGGDKGQRDAGVVGGRPGPGEYDHGGRGGERAHQVRIGGVSPATPR